MAKIGKRRISTIRIVIDAFRAAVTNENELHGDEGIGGGA